MVTDFFGVSDPFWLQYRTDPDSAFYLHAGSIMNRLYCRTNVEILHFQERVPTP
jgi:hypothetical protein